MVTMVLAGCRGSTEIPAPVEIPAPSVTPNPSPRPGNIFVILGEIGPNVNQAKAEAAIAIMNKYAANGCLHEKFLKRNITSLHNVEGPQVKTKEEAYQRYMAGAPYKLDLRWYSKRFSKTIGYTYNWLDGMDLEKCYNKPTPVCPTETKIYSNTNIIGDYSPGDYAAHLTHELSHQARAGGFVHWTEFDGTAVYELGHAMQDCVDE